MKLLIERGLMFGNPIRVNSWAWIRFYNCTLEKLTGQGTERDALSRPKPLTDAIPMAKAGPCWMVRMRQKARRTPVPALLWGAAR